MADTTAISWCDATFNPWWGCEKVSPACAHCYAEGEAHRRRPTMELWGAGHEFKFMAESTWAKPLTWARLLPAKLGRRPRVFCASMADVFEERPELEAPRQRLLELIEETPELDWLVLTKRPVAMRDRYFAGGWTLTPNLWLGVSIENARFTWRADVLREIPCAVRFISAEPLLGSLFKFESRPRPAGHPGSPPTESLEPGAAMPRAALDLTGIDWVIAGGESGARARPSHPDWFREVRDACLSVGEPTHPSVVDVSPDAYCKLARPAFHFKQWGAWADGSTLDHSGRDRVITVDGKVRTWPEWNEDGYSAGAGHARPAVMHRSSAKANGRQLDGRTWDEFPASRAVFA